MGLRVEAPSRSQERRTGSLLRKGNPVPYSAVDDHASKPWPCPGCGNQRDGRRRRGCPNPTTSSMPALVGSGDAEPVARHHADQHTSLAADAHLLAVYACSALGRVNVARPRSPLSVYTQKDVHRHLVLGRPDHGQRAVRSGERQAAHRVDHVVVEAVARRRSPRSSEMPLPNPRCAETVGPCSLKNATKSWFGSTAAVMRELHRRCGFS